MSSTGWEPSSEDMLDQPQFAVFYSVIVGVSDACSLFFIYTVITQSSADMKLYKYVLLKLAISDLLFNLSITLLVAPDLLCPLTAVAIRSPIATLSEDISFAMIAITTVLSVFVFTSINDCCFIRVCIFYQWNVFLRKLFSWRGIAFMFTANGMAAGLLIFTMWFARGTNAEFLSLVNTKNMTQHLGSYAQEPDTVYFFVNVYNPKIVPLFLSIASGITIIHTLNLFGSRLVWKGLRNRRKNMSFRSFSSHRQLTMLVLGQNIIPAIVLSIPVVMVTISFLLFNRTDTFAEVVKHFITVIICMYPVFSVILSFIFIQPYKKFLISIFCSFSLRRKRVQSRVSDVRMMSRKMSVGNESFDRVGYI